MHAARIELHDALRVGEAAVADAGLERVELDDAVGGKYASLVKLTFRTRLRALRLEATVQCNPTVLPYLSPGRNVVAVGAADPARLGRRLHQRDCRVHGAVRMADAVVLGEADETWPQVVADAERGELKDVYGPDGQDGRKPVLDGYKAIDWDSLDLSLFDLLRFVPERIRGWLKRLGIGFEKAYVVPLETGRGCPFACAYCASHLLDPRLLRRSPAPRRPPGRGASARRRFHWRNSTGTLSRTRLAVLSLTWQ